MKQTTYSGAFKEEALRKVLQRGRRTLGESEMRPTPA